MINKSEHAKAVFAMNKNVKKIISKGALGAAVGIASSVAFVGISDRSISEFWTYALMGSFLIFVFLHWVFREAHFDKLEVVRNITWMSLIYLVILFLYAFLLGAYIPMFICLGLFAVNYVIQLMIDILLLKKEDIS